MVGNVCGPCKQSLSAVILETCKVPIKEPHDSYQSDPAKHRAKEAFRRQDEACIVYFPHILYSQVLNHPAIIQLFNPGAVGIDYRHKHLPGRRDLCEATMPTRLGNIGFNNLPLVSLNGGCLKNGGLNMFRNKEWPNPEAVVCARDESRQNTGCRLKPNKLDLGSLRRLGLASIEPAFFLHQVVGITRSKQADQPPALSNQEYEVELLTSRLHQGEWPKGRLCHDTTARPFHRLSSWQGTKDSFCMTKGNSHAPKFVNRLLCMAWASSFAARHPTSSYLCLPKRWLAGHACWSDQFIVPRNQGIRGATYQFT